MAQLATQDICSTFKATDVTCFDGSGSGVRLRKPPKHSDKNRGPLFCGTNPISSAAIEPPLRATLEGKGTMILRTMVAAAIAQAAVGYAGVEFIDENGGGPGVRLRKTPKQKR